MKILLTGSRGFIGTQIFKTLTERGYNIDGVDQGDAVPDVKYDFILHFGARTLIRNSLSAPHEYFMDGLALTMKYLELARNSGATIVYPTSGSVEEATNPYSLSKKQGVEWINLYRKLYNVKAVVLKLYNIYGESSRKGAVYLFSKAALEQGEIPVYGGGRQVRDFVHVSDLVKCVMRIVDGQISPGDYEIGTGVGTSVLDLINIIESVSGKKIFAVDHEFILDEAPALFAKKPLPIDPLPIREGVKRVIEEISRSMR